MESARQTAMAFVEAVNSHRVEAIAELMAEDHVFVDTYGDRYGRAEMMGGWPGYFAWFPNCRIEIEQVMEDGDAVGLFGFASGAWRGDPGPDEKRAWRLPAVWRVVVRDVKVVVWQVYCDSKIPYGVMDD